MGTSMAILFTIFADVSMFTRNFYPFPHGKPWSTTTCKRQTGTVVFCLLFVGRLGSKILFFYINFIGMFASKAIGLSRRLERIPYPRIPYQGGSVFLPRNILDFLSCKSYPVYGYRYHNLFIN